MYDVIIIGAGVIGSATAYYLSKYNLKTALLDSENDVSNGTSKANSAIIHAGYDPKENTLMAKHNVEGSALAKQLCKELNVSYKQNGAMVLAFNDEEMKTVEVLYQRGCNNGVKDLQILNHDQIKELEPNLTENVVGALYAPTSAIISPWEYTLALAESAVANGVELKLRNEVTAIHKENEIFTVETTQGKYQTKYIINAAGVNSAKVHQMIGKEEFTISPSKGEYYLLDKGQGSLVSHTIFQCPNQDGKGVLVSPTVHGNLIVGPNAKNCAEDDLTTTVAGLAFVKEKAKKSVEIIDYRENIRNFAGIRAKSNRPDFIIEESPSVKNFFNLAGICSPGLSAAPSIALAAVEWLKSKETLTEKEKFINVPRPKRIKYMDNKEKDAKIKENPAYGRIVCRCEMVSEGEILDSFNEVIPPCSIDGVKRRANISMGRCQGGFCGEKVAGLLMREKHLNYKDVLQDEDGTNILLFEAKGEY